MKLERFIGPTGKFCAIYVARDNIQKSCLHRIHPELYIAVKTSYRLNYSSDESIS